MVSIAEVSFIKIDRYYEYSEKDLVIEAYKQIETKVKDYIKPDVVIVSSGYAESIGKSSLSAVKLSSSLGFKGVKAFRIENGDNGGPSIYTAYSLIKSGLAKSVLLIGIDKFSDLASKQLNDVLAMNLLHDHEYHLGLTPQSYAAILAKLYMKKYNVPYEYFANWPLKMHDNAVENPFAYLRFKTDIKTITSSQLVSEPLRIFDTAARADGAGIILLTDDEVAKKYTDTPVYLANVHGSIYEYAYDLSLPSIKLALNELKYTPSKNDIIEIHDSYSVLAALELEELGLGEKGKSLLELDSYQVNYSGGLKARGYPGGATAIYQLAEVVMQLRGDFPGKKAIGESGIVISADDLVTSSYISILKR
ncbi:thiolase family protein [Sulfolobus sp. S-194]|uniref:thiolase family protein n=1 Tax=Sulfolobus sp. S-194 TaxID=2512240 RepID=UPI0014372B9C|nr:thiolase family protein [Sulfolobus sp. S-194]QIW24227.1 thiolase family protein [Sulfolobus sp. S-194]